MAAALPVPDSEGSSFVNEDTPLLPGSEVQQKHDAVYNRFTKAQKRTILALICLAAVTPRKPECLVSRISCMDVSSTLALSVRVRILRTRYSRNSQRSQHHRCCGQVRAHTDTTNQYNSCNVARFSQLSSQPFRPFKRFW